MDARHFDALSRTLADVRTRRGLIGALAALPVAAGWLASRDEAEARKRKRHNARGAHDGHGPAAEKKKRKKKKKCRPESAAQTCAGRCGQATNNCGQTVACGSCACGAACPICQTCDAATGRCITNASFAGLACGLPGQVCLATGVCGCDTTSCADGQRCNGIVCVCDAASCPAGCCDGFRTCRADEDVACGTGGGICTHCPDCQTCKDGACASDTRQNRATCQLSGGADTGVCCNGSCCAGCCDAQAEHGACSPCLAFVTSTVSNGILGGLVGADRLCQARAEAGGFWGSYKAWLSNAVDSPSSRFRCTAASCSAQGYALVDGVSIASDWADLTTCDGIAGACLEALLVLSEFNQPVVNAAWTNTKTDGSPGGTTNVHCQNWTVGNNLFTGNTGFPELADDNWTRASFDPCNRGNSLYCFQQD